VETRRLESPATSRPDLEALRDAILALRDAIEELTRAARELVRQRRPRGVR